jgi:hypothetical protein
VTPRSASSASVGGLRFLGDQLRLTESKYRMPKDSDEQRIWEVQRFTTGTYNSVPDRAHPSG